MLHRRKKFMRFDTTYRCANYDRIVIFGLNITLIRNRLWRLALRSHSCAVSLQTGSLLEPYTFSIPPFQQNTLINCIWLTRWTAVLIINSSMAWQSSLLLVVVCSICQLSEENSLKCAFASLSIILCRSWYYEMSALIHSGWLKDTFIVLRNWALCTRSR